MSTILLAIVIMPSNTKMSTDIEKSAQENTRARNGDRRIIFSEREFKIFINTLSMVYKGCYDFED